MGQSFAFLGAFVTSAVLSIVLAYIAKITDLKAALNLWSLGYALNAARLLVYAVAGISPLPVVPFFLAEGFQALQSLALLFGVLFFTGWPVSLAKHLLPAALGALLLLALTAFVGDDGLLRVAPSYVVSAVCLLLAGIEVARSGRREGHTGSAFTAAILILWGLHKLDFLLLPEGSVEIAQLRFMVSAAFYTAAALGFAIMALTVFHRRLSGSLAENEAHFRKMFEDAPVGYQSLDETGRIVAVNRRWLDILGYAPDEVIGRSFADFLAPSSRSNFPQRFAQFKKTGMVQEVEFELRRKDGREILGSFEGRINPGADPGTFRTHCVLTDITARKQAETALRENEMRFKAIMDHSPAAIALRDRDGRFVIANPEYLRRANLTLEGTLGRSIREVKTADFADLVEAQEREVLASGEARLFRMEQKVGDTESTLAVVRFPVRDADGAISGVGVISLDITESRRAEEALRLSESRLQAILDHAPAEITHKDREGRYLLANKAYLRRKGVKVDDVLGKTIFDFTNAAEAREVRSQDEEVMATAQARSYQGVRRLASGGEGTFAIVRFPLFDDRGKIASIGVISIDVTREKQAEQARRDNEERLRLVLESTGEGIYAVDLEGRCTLCNPAAARILGYDHPDDLLGRDIHSMIHHSHADGRPYPLAECRAHRAIALKAPAFVDDEVFWRRDGRSIPVAIRSNPVVRNDEVVGTVVSFSDIGERKRAEAWLLRLSQSVEQSPFGVAITDAEGRFEYVNPSYCRETGYTFAEIAGKTMSTQNADGPGSVSDQMIAATLAGGGIWRGEVRHRRKNGEAYWVSLLVSPIRERNGRTVAYVAISEDISERRRMVDHLRQAQKMEAVGQLTGGVAHDFNNILSVILTSAECLADDLEGDAGKTPLVATIVRSVHRAADLTHRLLAFSRRQDLNPEVLDLSAVMGEMVELLRRSLGETIAVSVEAAAGLPPVLVDRGQFENALLNLALNARDAMPGGGALTIGIAPGEPPVSEGGGQGGRKRRFVCVSVRDNGTGMAPDVLDRVFEPFFTTKGKGQGTGLGLSMVYGFVRQSGGDIVVDSAENAGTTFRLYFPAAVDTVTASPDRQKGRAVAEASLPPLVIVLAEDDTGVRTATKFILESAGHTVFDAVNGIEALDILRRTPKVDLLVTDVIMPGGLSGRDLAKEAARLIPSLKILFTSGYADGYLSTGDIVAGMSAFVPKPYTKEILIGAIRSLGFGGVSHTSPESDS
ncbi:MAG: PAS domain S-box protein [Rhodospirillales bacterium]|nr:PAS domain S-box protein [Rhodospirillales bacterium]